MLHKPNKVKGEIVEWIRAYFEENGEGCSAVVGISGGKDSSVVAALCVEALGKDRVVGVLMPNGQQADIDCAKALVEHLEITSLEVNIYEAVRSLLYLIALYIRLLAVYLVILVFGSCFFMDTAHLRPDCLSRNLPKG